MKVFIKHVTFFIAPILIFVLISEILLRNIPNDYSFKSNYLERNANQIVTLFLGSSHIYFGLNPEFISSKSFNAAHTSQSLDLDLKILQKYSSNLESLKIIVVPVDYFSLYSRLETSVESWRVKNYSIYYGIYNDFKVENNTELFSSKLHSNLARLKQFYLNGMDDISCSNFGWGYTYNSKTNKNLISTGKEAAARHLAKNDFYFNDNVSVLKKIITLAKNKNCAVLFVTSPAYSSYVKELNTKQMNNTVNEILKLTNSNNNVFYLNLLSDQTFIKEDFYDADHLNEIGAKKFTIKIDSFIKSLKP